ncbi:MAG: CoA ester lyase [Thermomicrobium sp.]|nr:CoA ester lyase [Thermomicrobium sp.]MDW8059669.1 CoA ester lyase [Thermomicrobium sp.]
MEAERSVLSVPGSRPELFEKAMRSEADIVFLDLEDSVPDAAKDRARQSVREALRELDWRGRPRVVRINPLDSPHWLDDLSAIVAGSEGAVDVLILPKANGPEDVTVVARVLDTMEARLRLDERIRIEAQIETARGLATVEAIAGASDRLRALVFGPGDYAASVAMPMTAIGTFDRWDEAYGGSRLDYPMQRMLVAARMWGLLAIDGPYADFRDAAGLRRAALRARALGYDGKWCIHPAQIAVVNEVFTPTDEEVSWARTVLQAYEEAAREGRGAAAIGATMIDAASLRMAERTLARARAAARPSGERERSGES